MTVEEDEEAYIQAELDRLKQEQQEEINHKFPLPEQQLSRILWIVKEIEQRLVFKTMTDNEEMYWYDREQGIYLPGQEWRIKNAAQILYPDIKTNELNESVERISIEDYSTQIQTFLIYKMAC